MTNDDRANLVAMSPHALTRSAGSLPAGPPAASRRAVTYALLAVVLLVAIPLRADFSTIARTIQARTHAHRVWIPLFGLARFAVRCIHPEGVHDVQVVTFEGGSFDGVVPFDRSQLESGFQPLVEVHSARNGEWSLIYARSEPGGLVTLLVFAHDRHDTTLVQVVMDADRVAREVTRPRMMASVRRTAK